MRLLDPELRGARVCERKYVASATALSGAQAVVALHCAPDTAHPCGIVESIYFDDGWLSSYFEKTNGDFFKRKVRFRWYSPLAGAPPCFGTIPAFLDVKDRVGAVREKRLVAFQADAAILNAPTLRTADLKRTLEREMLAAGLPIAGTLEPMLAIRYRRQRFVCPATGAKINLDSEIRSPRSNPDIFPGCLPLESGRIVCEVKAGVVREGPWAEGLLRLGFRLQSFSKYGLFMETHLHGSI